MSSDRVTCLGGPLDNRAVSSNLGDSWQYCLTPWFAPPERTYGTYLREGDYYRWHGSLLR